MNVFLSPHCDDVCFSLGDFASQRGGCLVTMFSRSEHVGAPQSLPDDRQRRIAFVSALRRREDEAFAEAAGLDRRDLGLEEPSLLGFEAFDLQRLGPAIARTSATLTAALLDLLPSDADPQSTAVYCPIGIGGHRDHLSTLVAMRGAYPRLADRCTLCLYEDLHYASDAARREAGLRRVFDLFAGFALSSTAHVLDAEAAARKLGWIALYASQLPYGVRAGEFIPASGLSSSLHEIVWRVGPRS
jgi:hypothetical protein